MVMKTRLGLLTFVSTSIMAVCSHAGTGQLAAYPAPETGQVRSIVQLPEREDESAYMLELIIGKTVETDGVNRSFFTGRIEEKTIEGWGYTYFVVSNLGQRAGTLMAPRPDQPMVEEFVTLGGEPYLIPYNSRLPVVIYVPEGSEVRYRLWSAGEVIYTQKPE